VLLNEKKEQ